MLVNKDINLSEFEFWGGAKSLVNYLKEDELTVIQEFLEDLWPEGLSECQLNDLFAFDKDFIASIIGYEDFEQLMEERK